MVVTECAINVTKAATLLANVPNLMVIQMTNIQAIEAKIEVVVEQLSATSVTDLATLLEIVVKRMLDATDVTALVISPEIVDNSSTLAITVTRLATLSRIVPMPESRTVTSAALPAISAASAVVRRRWNGETKITIKRRVHHFSILT